MSNTTEKNILLERLTLIQDSIDKRVDEKAAASTVKAAEINVTQADVDHAKNMVSDLPDSGEKKALFERLSVVQESIDFKRNVSSANQAVQEAENTKEQTAVDKAQEQVDTLPTSDEKSTLLDRLNAVQGLIDYINNTETAEKLVSEVENSKEQIAVDQAHEKINNLPAFDKKVDLLKRLDAVQTLINHRKKISIAEQAVQQAENTNDQVDVDKAQEQVHTLPTSDEQIALLDKLKEVQKLIQNRNKMNIAEQVVEEAEHSEESTDIDQAFEKVDALLESDEKTALLARLDAVQISSNFNKNVNLADQAIRHAEDTKNQLAISQAEEKANRLPDSSEKIALLERLDAIQAIINFKENVSKASQVVKEAEDTNDQSVVDQAQRQIKKLQDSEEKMDLLDRVDAVQELINYRKNETITEHAVREAEKNNNQTKVNKAYEMVEGLLESEDKEVLLERLDVIQKSIHSLKNERIAEEALLEAEKNKEQPYINYAREKIEALSASNKKATLLERLETIQEAVSYRKNEIIADLAVREATITEEQVDINQAWGKVDILSKSDKKIALAQKLNEIQILIDFRENIKKAKVAVREAISNKTQADVDKALEKVAVLSESDEKMELSEKLNEVQILIDLRENIKKAESAVREAESNKTQADVDKAREKIAVLSESEDKTTLFNKIDTIQEVVTAIENEQIATKAVREAESKKMQVNINQAREKIEALSESEGKLALSERLDTIQELIHARENEKIAIAAVRIAKLNEQQKDINYARKQVDVLPESTRKNDLLQRLDEIQEIVKQRENEQNADNAVIEAEKNKQQLAINHAWEKINVLSESDRKNGLTTRLYAVQKRLNLELEVDLVRKQLESLPDSSEKRNLLETLNTIERLNS